MILIATLLQAAAPAADPPSLRPPDLQIGVRARAKSVRVEQKGTSYLRLTTDPDGGNVVDVQAPSVDRSARDVTVTIDAQTRIADPAAATPPR